MSTYYRVINNLSIRIWAQALEIPGEHLGNQAIILILILQGLPFQHLSPAMLYNTYLYTHIE